MRTERVDMTMVGSLILVPALTFIGCGGGGDMGGEPMEAEPPAPVIEAEPPSEAMPRVFFVAPQDGAQVSSDFDLELEFGVENFEISPVPEEVETPRPDVGHYHVGVDTGCLPVGEIIPQGGGWVHFGDGSNTFTLQVEPGTYELSVQIGDDEHRTLPDLCDTITVTVADGI